MEFIKQDNLKRGMSIKIKYKIRGEVVEIKGKFLNKNYQSINILVGYREYDKIKFKKITISKDNIISIKGAKIEYGISTMLDGIIEKENKKIAEEKRKLEEQQRLRHHNKVIRRSKVNKKKKDKGFELDF